MLFQPNHTFLAAQALTTQAPPAPIPADPPQALPEAPDYPLARALPAKSSPDEPDIQADTQTLLGGHLTLDGNVLITYGDRTLEADHVEYDRQTGNVEATGHLVVNGGPNQEHIAASHGILNLNTQNGRFYDVTGSVGIKTKGTGTSRQIVYTNDTPFTFTGQLVIKSGPRDYDIYEGTVTSCALPKPDWLLSAAHFNVEGDRAKARNSIFRVINVPLLYLPYVTHSTDAQSRQSGFFIPTISQSSTKGLILGEEVYLVINRSTDLTLGAEYYSLRGWSQSATFRFRGRGDDFLRTHYSGLLDRFKGAANQGGEDFIVEGRHDVDPETRLIVNAEYLSSFTYREAFSDNFNQAVSTDVLSTVFADHEHNGYDASFYFDRYQGLKTIAIVNADGSVTPGAQVRIFHAPSLDLSSVDRALGHSGLTFDFDLDAAGLKRVQPNFQTSGITERLDARAELAYPLSDGAWHFRPSVAVRDTYYSRSRATPTAPGAVPVESINDLNRSDVEVTLDARPPVIERTFDSGPVEHLFHTDVTHTIEPELTYRYVTGINHFLTTLRFDDRDVLSDTNEFEYGVTQRLFLRPRARKKPCNSESVAVENPLLGDLTSGVTEPGNNSIRPKPGCGTREWITWRVTQKYFFDPTFGGAIQNGRRNIFDTTLDFSGIAFLTEPRNISPLLSRLRVRASEKVDFEWDADYDTGAKKFTSYNVFADAHEGPAFAGLSFARLNAPGRAYSEGVSSSVSNFTQMRVLLGYGEPTKAGLSVGGSAGFDLIADALQYASIQTSYNFDCCGFAIEYRKYELGSVRNESVYRFNITLANIGTAGNLKRAERLF
jgi:LPS-assembly protein